MNKTNSSGNRKNPPKVRKPFITGSPIDENTAKNSLLFFGSLLIVFFIGFIACSTIAGAGIVIRVLLNTAVILISLVIFFNNGVNQGADAVARGEILYQRQEKGLTFSASEKNVCYHSLKGLLNGLFGTLPFLVLALILAFCTQLQTTDSGTLPSWMQAYVRRSDIGNALVNYTQPEGMSFLDLVRALVRICILPFVNLFGYDNNASMLTLERLSPLFLLLPSVCYGVGYMKGKEIRDQIHTAISVSDKKRKRTERKKQNASRNAARSREPRQLN